MFACLMSQGVKKPLEKLLEKSLKAFSGVVVSYLDFMIMLVMHIQWKIENDQSGNNFLYKFSGKYNFFFHPS